MAIEHSNKPSQPPALRATLTMTPQELEDKLRSVYRLGVAKGIRLAEEGQIHNQPVMPTCPRHPKVPMWMEAHPTRDGSWLYCPFCRQDARSAEYRHTEALRKIELRKP